MKVQKFLGHHVYIIDNYTVSPFLALIAVGVIRITKIDNRRSRVFISSQITFINAARDKIFITLAQQACRLHVLA